MGLSMAVRSAMPGKRWLPGQVPGAPAPMAPIGTGPVGGPTDPIGLKVELFLGGSWVDISPYVYYKTKIRITRGKPNETSQIQPQTAVLTINNRDGRFSPRNPLGPYYGLIGRNTPIRISRLQNGTRRYRFHGEVPSWPTTWDITGTDVRATITASGPMRRLFQGNQPLHSSLYRTYGLGFGLPAGLGPYAYWPCEDGKNASSIASGLPGGTAMTLSGQALPTFASNTSFPSSLALPLLSGSTWTGQVPTYTGSTSPTAVGGTAGVGFLMSVPSTGAYDGGVLMRMWTTGTVARLDLVYSVVRGGALALLGYSSTGTLLLNTGYTSPQDFTGFGLPGFNGLPVFVDMMVTNNPPGNVIAEADFKVLYPQGALTQSFAIGAVSVAGSLGIATSVVVNPDGHFNDTAIGHIFVQGYSNFSIASMAFNGWITEPCTSPLTVAGFAYSSGRFLRLCQEQNVSAAVISATGVNAGDTTTMGYQLNDTFGNLVQQPAITSAGLLFEARDQNALILRERNSLNNQAAKLTLDHSLHQLSGPLNPVDDDALTRNDITVTRINGSSVTQQQTTGTLSIQPPPAGVGDYSTTYNLSLGSDSQLADHAGWRLHLGTVDQPRYPQIPINLRHPTFTGSLDMMNAALTIDIGDRLVVTNPPPWMPPDPISQIVLGYIETLGTWEHDMVFNCAPEDPYRVGLLDDPVLGRADTDGSTLGLPAAATDTTLAIATTGATTGSPLWTIAAADFPLDVAVGGERVTLNSYVLPPVGGGADPSFESGVSGWTTTGTVTIAQSLADHYIGSASGLLNGGATGAGFLTPAGNAPATANTPYYVFVAYKLAFATVNVQFYIQWFTPSGSGNGTTVIGNPAATSSWNTMSAIVTSPAGTGQAYPALQLSGGTNFQLYVDYFILQNLVTGQVFNVTRAVNGVVKAQTTGTDVRLWQPMYLSM